MRSSEDGADRGPAAVEARTGPLGRATPAPAALAFAPGTLATERGCVHALHTQLGNGEVLAALSGGGEGLHGVVRAATAVGLSGVSAASLTPGTAPLSLMRQVLTAQGQAEAEGLETGRAEARLGRLAGVPLPEPVRARMERALGADLQGVRLHLDAGAAQAARDLGARAFTEGQDIYFGPGAWAPETAAGLELLAHELTHVVQAQQGRVRAPSGGGLEVSSPSDPLEREAEAAGRAIAAALDGAPEPAPALEPATPEPAREAAPTQVASPGDPGVLYRDKETAAAGLREGARGGSSRGAKPGVGVELIAGKSQKIEGEVRLRVWGPVFIKGKFTAEASKEAHIPLKGSNKASTITSLSIQLEVGVEVDLWLFTFGLSLFGGLQVKVKDAPSYAVAAVLGLHDILACLTYQRINKETRQALSKVRGAYTTAAKGHAGVLSAYSQELAQTSDIARWASLGDARLKAYDAITDKQIGDISAVASALKAKRSKAQITDLVHYGTDKPMTVGTMWNRDDLVDAQKLARKWSSGELDPRHATLIEARGREMVALEQVQAPLKAGVAQIQRDRSKSADAFIGLQGGVKNNPNVEWEASVGWGAHASLDLAKKDGGKGPGIKGSVAYKETWKRTDPMGQRSFDLKRSSSHNVTAKLEIGGWKFEASGEWDTRSLKLKLGVMYESSQSHKSETALQQEVSPEVAKLLPKILTPLGKGVHSIQDFSKRVREFNHEDLSKLTREIKVAGAAGFEVEVNLRRDPSWRFKDVTMKLFTESSKQGSGEWSKKLGGSLSVSKQSYVAFQVTMPEPEIGTCVPPKA
ncbi:MAG: DUF4157 domain-containing protein [Alphaproteobacteria bacterium]|nr:DUF4157 domain-containing protein [Alphaproteobacteria bacterium]